jgi:predicted HTH domain antitoxin
MLTTKYTTTRVEVELSNDVVFAMKSFGQPEKVQQTIKTALAIFLFQEDAISFGKAAEVAGMPQGQFCDLLQAHGIAAYEYTGDAMVWDDEAVAAYQQAMQP